MKSILTIDVEEHFQVEAFAHVIDPANWENRQSRLTMNLIRLVDLLDQHQTKATFFVLGWIAERYPHLVSLIKGRGHEIASHGYSHKSLKRMTPDEFRTDLKRSLAAIKDACGARVTGYRAPTFSADRGKTWIWDTLLECGIEYDSSIYPVRHDLYGDPAAPRFPYFLDGSNGSIFEIPPTTYRAFGHSLPACGGGSLRLFPFWYTRRAIEAYNRSGYAAMVYLHPWEIDPAQPREQEAGFKSRLRHYTNLRTMETKLRRLLSDYSFGSVRDVYPDFRKFLQESRNRQTAG